MSEHVDTMKLCGIIDGSPNYDAMTREQIIAYCDRLREAIMHANPLGLVHSGDFDAAAQWEREAVQALYSHGSRP